MFGILVYMYGFLFFNFLLDTHTQIAFVPISFNNTPLSFPNTSLKYYPPLFPATSFSPNPLITYIFKLIHTAGSFYLPFFTYFQNKNLFPSKLNIVTFFSCLFQEVSMFAFHIPTLYLQLIFAYQTLIQWAFKVTIAPKKEIDEQSLKL